MSARPLKLQFISERNRMKRSTIEIAMRTVVAMMLMAATAFAQTSKANSASENYDLLPGLDKQLIDTSANPCVDFFQYACGNFSKLHPIPNDRASFGTGAMI